MITAQEYIGNIKNAIMDAKTISAKAGNYSYIMQLTVFSDSRLSDNVNSYSSEAISQLYQEAINLFSNLNNVLFKDQIAFLNNYKV